MKRILLSMLPLMAVFFLTVSCDPTNKNNPEVQDTLTVHRYHQYHLLPTEFLDHSNKFHSEYQS